MTFFFLDKVNNILPQVEAKPEPSKIIPGRDFGTIRKRLECLIAAVKTGKRVLFGEMPA